MHPSDPMRIKINLNQVSGIGDLSGLRYEAFGANRINISPPNPVAELNLGYTIKPTNITPSDPVGGKTFFPLDITFELFSSIETGQITATLVSMEVPLGD